jgi:hypothetical protein
MAGGDYSELFISKEGVSRTACTLELEHELDEPAIDIWVTKGQLHIDNLTLYQGHAYVNGLHIWVHHSQVDDYYTFVLAADRDGKITWGGISGYQYHGAESFYYPIRAAILTEYLGWVKCKAIEESEEYSPFVLAESFLEHLTKAIFEMEANPDPDIGRDANIIYREHGKKMNKLRAEKGMKPNA